MRPLIIGHRGACGHLPEHTLASFQRAVELGADAVETDVVMTRDGHLVCRHDVELSITTNVASQPQFAAREAIRTIDGIDYRGWFMHDFLLSEIRALRARERFVFRDHALDDRFPIPSLDELLEWAAGQQTRGGQQLAVIIEVKHSTYFESVGLPMDDALVAAIERRGMGGSPMSYIFIESFELAILKRLRQRIATPLIQLLDAPSVRPADVAAASGTTTYRDMITIPGLTDIASYVTAIGAWKQLIVPAQLDGGPEAVGMRLGQPTSLIADAHAAGLAVHAWTFRDEAQFLAADYAGDPAREYAQFAELGLDGFITDFPDTARSCLMN